MAPFIVPLMRCSCHVPLAEKHPQSIMFPPHVWRWGWCSWGHRQHSSSSNHGEFSWCLRARFWSHPDHKSFPQFSSESFRCSLANFRQACTCALLSRGTCGRCRISVLHGVLLSVLLIVFLVTMVSAILRSLTRSSSVVLGWFLTVLMIIETQQGEILHEAQTEGDLTLISCFFHLRIIAITFVTFSPSCLAMVL